MTNEELKKKIISVLQSVEFVTEKGWCGQCISLRLDYSAIADALISAGIGDIREAEHRAEVAEAELARCKRAFRIAGDKFINEVCNMRGEDISDKCDYKCDTCFYDYYLQQVEKELAEEGKEC